MSAWLLYRCGPVYHRNWKNRSKALIVSFFLMQPEGQRHLTLGCFHNALINQFSQMFIIIVSLSLFIAIWCYFFSCEKMGIFKDMHVCLYINGVAYMFACIFTCVSTCVYRYTCLCACRGQRLTSGAFHDCFLPHTSRWQCIEYCWPQSFSV